MAPIAQVKTGPTVRPALEELAAPQTASTSAASITLSKALKRQGWKFVGPTTAMGLVNDHVEGCAVRPRVVAARQRFRRPG